MSDSGSGAPWSAQQLSWLQAMGHVVYLDPADVPESVPEPVVATVRPSLPVPPRRPPAAASGRRTAAGAPPEQPPRRHAAATGGGFRLPDRLQIALLRASGCNPADPRVQALMASWPPLAELRADPAAKRALWPQLRALRRKPLP